MHFYNLFIDERDLIGQNYFLFLVMRIVGGLVAVGVVAIILRCLSTSPEVVQEEKECLRKLRHAPIVSVSAFGAEGSRSKKALVTLHGSFKAVIKLIKPSVLPRKILHQNPALTEQYDRGEFGVFYQVRRTLPFSRQQY